MCFLYHLFILDFINSDCNGFFLCTGEGVAVAQDCPSGLFFDPEHQICNWPENVDCVADDSPETLECMEGATAYILSSEESGEESGEDGVDFKDMKKSEMEN